MDFAGASGRVKIASNDVVGRLATIRQVLGGENTVVGHTEFGNTKLANVRTTDWKRPWTRTLAQL